MWRDLGMSLPLCYSHLFASDILLRKFVLILPRDTFFITRGKKRLAKFVYTSSIISSGKMKFSLSNSKCHPKRRK